MGLFSKLFGNSGSNMPKLVNMPPLYGGDGLSVSSPVVVNCASTSMANALIDNYITEQCGKKDIDWKIEYESFIDLPHVDEFTIRCISIKFSNGVKKEYYFDLLCPMIGTKKMA